MSDLKAVFYCDGGFLLDLQKGGAGVHGYIYNGLSEKQENILGKWTPTEEGYVPRDDKTKSVSILKYVDIIKGLDDVSSSSETELNAINKALEWLEDTDDVFSEVLILSDSKNVIQGISGWIKNWKKNNWMTSSGSPVKFSELWKVVDSRMENLTKDNNLKLKFQWIKGHDGNLGNEKADDLATRGILLNKNGDGKTITVESERQSYWTPPSSVKPPRLLDGPRLYSNTYNRDRFDPDKSATYFIGSHGAKERLAEEQGKVYPCNYLSVIRVNKSDPVIGALQDLVLDLEENRSGTLGTVITFNLQNLMSTRYYSEVLSNGLLFTERLTRPIIVNTAKGSPLAEEVVPVGRAFRLVDFCASAEEKLSAIDKNDLIKRQSLIPVFFDEIKKKDDTKELKIKKEISSALKSIKVDGEFSVSTTNLEEEVFKKKLTLILGIDTPLRNTLSALAKDIVEFDLVSWRDSKNSVRYATYIKLSDGEDGLWIKYDSNLLINAK